MEGVEEALGVEGEEKEVIVSAVDRVFGDFNVGVCC